MKAIVVKETGPPEVMKLQEVNKPKPDANQVLIQVEAISVNFADIKARQGQYHGVAADSAFTPGLDCAGIVTEVGEQVKSFKTGQRVMAFPAGGSYAEFVVASEKLTYPVPDDISSETAAASLTVGITAYNVIQKMARLEKGETILIHAAAGGIGSTAIQLAKLFGASKIFGTVGSDEKIARAKSFGADEVINYRSADFVEKVNELTEGKGADIILDTVAGENFEKSLKCLATFGRIVSFGHANDGSKPGIAKTNELHSSCRTVIGYSTGTYRKNRPEFLREGAEKTTEYLLQKQLEIIISKSFALADAAEAHAHIESRSSIGKVLLIP
ncbi:NADPH:quinone oxidoreductase family protein [Planococcus sp. CPCC 101016]|uniref:quinone oxidoreductase family protein n=1 Tax=Planococcus sp. CPCC 101016 TaxID=2599617 RepID=UPI0011B80407|nr:NADPH:quinone oxidoreductase family protein [Planococcus sp. CPCC 101016]TWT06777.1 NADPH:quinone oxidoreductase family protein [Planococcus sp. CPCC 101016]